MKDFNPEAYKIFECITGSNMYGTVTPGLANILGCTKSHVSHYVKRMGLKVKQGRLLGIPMSSEQKELLSWFKSGTGNLFDGKKHNEKNI